MIVSLPPGFLALSEVRLFADSSRGGTPIKVPVIVDDQQRLTVDVTEVPAGRYYPLLAGTLTDGHDGAVPGDALDLPLDPRLLISPETLAVGAGLTLPLNNELRELLTEAILDAQDDVYAYLGQPIVPTLFRQDRCWPHANGWELTAHGDTDIIEVISADPEYRLAPDMPGGRELTGTYLITYLAGLDARLDPALRPIRRYVKAHALAAPEVGRYWQRVTKAKGAVTNISAEGQSISFKPATLGSETPGRPGDGSPGSLPTLASLDYWRVAGRRVHVAQTRSTYGAPDRWWPR